MRFSLAPHRRLGVLYGAIGLAGLGLGVSAWPWGCVLLWPALAAALESAAYLGRAPGVYRKKHGRLPLAIRILMGPSLLGHWVSWRYHKNQGNAWDEIAPGVLLGRLLTGGEGERAVAAGVRAVLDLTGECSEHPSLARLDYLNISLLDLTSPSLEQFQAGVRFIEERRAAGTVYVHCKLGYGRSAAVIAAWLIHRGEAATAREAVDRVLRRRPQVIMRPESIEMLERFVQARQSQPRRVRS